MVCLVTQTGRKCWLDSSAVMAETEKAKRNRFRKMIRKLRREWLCQVFGGKNIDYVKVKEVI